MKVAQLAKFGSENFQIVDIEPPILQDDQILIGVHSACINPFDVKFVSGVYGGDAPFPITAGGDFSGVVKKVEGGVSEFKIGDEVFGSALIQNGGSGSFAAFSAANTKNTALKPKNASFDEAAALPLVGSSATQALEDHIKLRSGQKILIHGGAGGIGHMAVQIAKEIGAYVATTVSSDDVEFARSLGADEVIDYKTQDFSQILKDFDAVFDTVGESVWEKSFEVLKKGGVIVSMLGQPGPETAKQKGINSIGQFTQTNTQHLIRLADYVDKGKVKVSVDKIFPLEEIRQAFQYQENNSPNGKVVIKMK